MDSAREITDAMRIIDANFNRASEGLRVIEEYLRFVLDDSHLTSICKHLRHQLAEASSQNPIDRRTAARDTQTDVGTEISTPGEVSRPSNASVAQASIKRVQQALRCLEEYSKTIDSNTSAAFEAIRYESYTLEKAIQSTETGRSRLDGRTLYVLADGAKSLEAFRQRNKDLFDAGVRIMQLRDKSLADRDLLERANLLREQTRNTDTMFVMNDRPDLAVLSRADGIHVGQEELSVKDVRRIVGPTMLIGVSTHSIQQARQAVLDGANYIGVGPTFPSNTKQFDQFTGIELLTQVSSEISLPAFAIGGINGENLSQVIGSGFCRIAVSHAVTSAKDPASVVRELLAGLSDLARV